MAVMSKRRLFPARLPKARIVGERTIDLSGVPADMRALFSWQPNWKTALLGRILANRPGILVDIGANVGQTLLDYVASGSVAGYVGFEPNPRCADGILSLIRRNGLPNAAVIPVGLSATDHIAPLHLRRGVGIDASASLIADLRPDRDLETIFVPCYRFDAIEDATIGGSAVSAVKIDVEGAELYALQGMEGFLRTQRPFVLCEVLRRDGNADHPRYQARTEALHTLLSGLGYAIYLIEKREDLRDVARLTRIDAFTQDPWIPASAELNDYLFIPASIEPPSWLGAR
jgi:FkbM family methyltransferase